MCTQHNVRVSQILGHKTSLSKFMNTEIIPRIFFFSEHNVMKLKINNRKKAEKFTKEEEEDENGSRVCSIGAGR